MVDNLLRGRWELPLLCASWNQVDVAIAFLVSVGGDKDRELVDFITETLGMENALHMPVVSNRLFIEIRH
jgi:hypothetical protein